MASHAELPEIASDDPAEGAALQHRAWRRSRRLSRGLAEIERFLDRAGFDRAPWLAVAFGTGIALWFVLPNLWQWVLLLASCVLATCSAMLWRAPEHPFLRTALIAIPLLLAAGCLTVWAKSELVGARPIDRPGVETFTARILSREERPAEGRVRLVLATRPGENGSAIRVRVNVPEQWDDARLSSGATVRLRARLMPPAPPMLPGGYDFARTAWFSGLSATGSVIAPVEVLTQDQSHDWLGDVQGRLSRHVREQLGGSAGGIAAALASGDRGGIGEADAQAMRDAGLAHLLSISGLHVSAVIAAGYVLAIRLLALWPWLALRVRLPIAAAGAGALAGVGYTLLTGAEVPTVRSCVGALLVLIALALGREALSLRLLAVAAFLVLLLWPESIVGPSFQMSFSAVIAIIALNTAGPVRRFLAPRDEPWLTRRLRLGVMLFLTGLVIELALMPIALYHFHRAGVYGAFANVIAIPLTTMVTMPLIALALVLDIAGAGAPAWWLAGHAIDGMLSMAHWISAQPGSVKVLPAMGAGSYALFIAGGLWLALWRAKIRWLGLAIALVGAANLAMLRPPDLLVTGDGRHVAVVDPASHEVHALRDTQSTYVRDNIVELAGSAAPVQRLADARGVRCSPDFCTVNLRRGGRDWHLLMARSRDQVPERALAAACERADIVIADRWLPRSCRPRWLKADRNLLARTGGMAIDLRSPAVTTVAQEQGGHGWWRGGPARSLRF